MQSILIFLDIFDNSFSIILGKLLFFNVPIGDIVVDDDKDGDDILVGKFFVSLSLPVRHNQF